MNIRQLFERVRRLGRRRREPRGMDPRPSATEHGNAEEQNVTEVLGPTGGIIGDHRRV
jgi:hypothetical protein